MNSLDITLKPQPAQALTDSGRCVAMFPQARLHAPTNNYVMSCTGTVRVHAAGCKEVDLGDVQVGWVRCRH